MKPLFNLLIGLLFLLACVDSHAKPAPRPVNYIVLLDLSDRLLLPGQTANDHALIQTVFAQFKQTVFKKNLVINSHDKFRVVIAPQQGVAYDPADYMTQLFLDMELLQFGQKRTRMEAFERALPTMLQTLYKTASQNKSQARQFSGCDLWKYFNEQLATDVVENADNRLIVLTDGYLDFQHNPYVMQQKHRSTSTDFIKTLRQQEDWRAAMKLGNWGLLPIKASLPNLSVDIVEINPKSPHLAEADILQAVWQDWLTGMGVKKPTFILKSNLSKSQTLLQNDLALR